MIASAISAQRPAPIARAALSAAQNLLLVHYDWEELHLLAEFLGDSYYLLTAKSEDQAVRILEARAVQLAIINTQRARLPEGKELCARLKSSRQFAHIPVILMIAENDPAARIGCLDCGADAWLERPLSRDYLRAQIRNLIANRTRVKDHFHKSAQAQLNPLPWTGGKEAFLNRLGSLIEHNLYDVDLNVDALARLMNMSVPTLYRKIKGVSDQTPNELINIARLNKAAGLLSCTDHRIFEIAKMVGFNTRSNFGKAFLKHFAVTPRIYQQMIASG